MNLNKEVRMLLHEKIFMPDWMQRVCMNKQSKQNMFMISKHFRVDHSQLHHDFKHAVTAQELIDLGHKLALAPIPPFEIELTLDEDTDKFIITKQVVRMPYDDDTDISIVFRCNKIITAWLNGKTDSHATLNETRYVNEVTYTETLKKLVKKLKIFKR